MEKLEQNIVIKWDADGGKPHFERLLAELPGDPGTWAVISLDENVGLPYTRTAEEITKGLAAGTVTIAVDPYAFIAHLSDADLSDFQKEAKNTAWKILEPLVRDPKQPLLLKETRNKALQKSGLEHTIPVPKLFEWTRRFYQRRMSEFGLTPDSHLRGAPGKTHGGTQPRGRPPEHGKQVVNITPAIAKKLITGLNEFYVKQKFGFGEALDMTKRVHFCKSIALKGSQKIYTLEPWAEWITVGQARYHFLKEQNLPALARKRMGAKKYDKDERGATGNSTLMASGPGALYMIDATIADTYLRHPWTHEPIGRPTVYLVVDVYTHMAVGFHVTFEPPSISAAALAIVQAIRDKGEVLMELGLEGIDPAFWPAQGIPYAFLGDRGELISKHSDTITRVLDCVLENTKAYRGDSKGIVEQAFRQSNLHTVKWTDGYVSKDRDRDDQLPKKTTTVHPRAFCQALAVGLINRNMQLLDGYPMSKEHYVEGVEPRPLELWKWGMAKKTGILRSIDTKCLHQKLLPRYTAEATQFGFLFRGVTFTNERLQKSDYFSLAGLKSRSKVTIAIDPRSLANTFLVPDKFGSELEPLELTSKWKQGNYGELSWRELEVLFDGAKVKKVAATGKDLHRGINARAYQMQILAESKVHFETTKPHSDPSGVTAKDNIRRLETKFGGVGNVPTDHTSAPAGTSPGKPSAAQDDDEEHALNAQELLKSLESHNN